MVNDTVDLILKGSNWDPADLISRWWGWYPAIYML